MLSHRFFDHFGSILVVGRVLLAGVDAHFQDFGLHIVAHIGLKLFILFIKFLKISFTVR
jgi:hypothetical protein